jgi:hypothetical protein
MLFFFPFLSLLLLLLSFPSPSMSYLSHTHTHTLSLSLPVCIRCLSRLVTIAAIIFLFVSFTKINDASDVSLKSGRQRVRPNGISAADNNCLYRFTCRRNRRPRCFSAAASVRWPELRPVIFVHFFTQFPLFVPTLPLTDCCAGGRKSSSEWPRHTHTRTQNVCKIQRQRERDWEPAVVGGVVQIVYADIISYNNMYIYK